MTNHIEELMKAAEVEKQYYSFKSADGNTYNWELNENGNEKHKKHFIQIVKRRLSALARGSSPKQLKD